jgi:hypothetical protein
MKKGIHIVFLHEHIHQLSIQYVFPLRFFNERFYPNMNAVEPVD